MSNPTPRHRRKAGTGPPAAALIAWIKSSRQRNQPPTTDSTDSTADLDASPAGPTHAAPVATGPVVVLREVPQHPSAASPADGSSTV